MPLLCRCYTFRLYLYEHTFTQFNESTNAVALIVMRQARQEIDGNLPKIIIHWLSVDVYLASESKRTKKESLYIVLCMHQPAIFP